MFIWPKPLKERTRRQALTHFISQQRVGGLSVSLIWAAGAANSRSASGKNLKGRRKWCFKGGRLTLGTSTVQACVFHFKLNIETNDASDW